MGHGYSSKNKRTHLSESYVGKRRHQAQVAQAEMLLQHGGPGGERNKRHVGADVCAKKKNLPLQHVASEDTRLYAIGHMVIAHLAKTTVGMVEWAKDQAPFVNCPKNKGKWGKKGYSIKCKRTTEGTDQSLPLSAVIGSHSLPRQITF